VGNGPLKYTTVAKGVNRQNRCGFTSSVLERSGKRRWNGFENLRVFLEQGRKKKIALLVDPQ